MTLPVGNDQRTATKTSTWGRRSRANSIVSTNVRQLQTVILIAVASLGVISETPEGELALFQRHRFFEHPLKALSGPLSCRIHTPDARALGRDVQEDEAVQRG